MKLLRTENVLPIQTIEGMAPAVYTLAIKQMIIKHLNELPLDELIELVEFRILDPREPECWNNAKTPLETEELRELERSKQVKFQCKTSIEIDK